MSYVEPAHRLDTVSNQTPSNAHYRKIISPNVYVEVRFVNEASC